MCDFSCVCFCDQAYQLTPVIWFHSFSNRFASHYYKLSETIWEEGGVLWCRVAERRLNATVLVNRSAALRDAGSYDWLRSVGSSPRLPLLSRSARRGEKVRHSREELALLKGAAQIV